MQRSPQTACRPAIGQRVDCPRVFAAHLRQRSYCWRPSTMQTAMRRAAALCHNGLQQLYAQSHCLSLSAAFSSSAAQPIRWVFLGPPGVGKGTYASRIAQALSVPHIAAGDLVRAEIKSGSALGQQMQTIVNSGKLLPDEVIIRVLQQRLVSGQQSGEAGFILDGFPRTVPQAQQLSQLTPIDLALNLSLREEVLVEKCMGRRMCRECGGNYNIANIYLPAGPGRPEIVMPPLNPPDGCWDKLEVREDDKEEVIRKRLQVYNQGAAPVEQYYEKAGLLLDFEITGGIPETMPVLMEALQPFMPGTASSREGAGEQEAMAVA